ncbi:Rieske 2Fe-2S domain-containing protein [Actinoplanes derwentensis]|uniref:Rieske-type oxygenase n=1 Tax=Actinoplanes derwentensis TaxID=113562 RepID=A0A1H2B259_9ACTN|nr:Rieske 2Fe-2S domain-containing protein [Actinoplanes derwentensis]GID87576.1 3-ketosteroid-9-alpha-hydroxylase oxygenase subunit [Actinoplanes derwentensis]SDT52335.1 3-ketosteroid 9alpha-monooxygenase subunit A [Actinoplanes derwentensis]
MSISQQPRTIDVGRPPVRFARGWHCLGLAEGFRDGQPHAIDAFGTRLVVFADSHGELHVLDGYCRHMGGDLTQGTIKGDTIACPFHDWRWRGDGRCAEVPYAHRIPARARTRSWTTCEQNRQLFVWHDPQGRPPPPEVAIPRIEGAFSDEWSDWTWDSVRIDGANCREIIDNVVDMAHFFYIHFAFPTFFKNVIEGHVAAQFLQTRPRPDVPIAAKQSGDATLRSEAAYYGPSYMIDYLHNDWNGIEIESVLINCHYPVAPDSFVLQWGVIMKRLPGLTREQAAKAAGKFTKGIGVGFLQDVEIWKNKTRIDNPLLCAEDGPVYQLRRWYEQFYVDVDDVTDDMVARYEFEVDTTRAVETWEAEVAANQARAATS